MLGPVHPILLDNINMLRQISKKQEVSFHMSGTEATMYAATSTLPHWVWTISHGGLSC